MPITDQILDQLLADCKSPEDLMGEQGLLRQLTKKLAERALEAEMEHHLGYPKNSCIFRDDLASDFGMSRPPISVSSGH